MEISRGVFPELRIGLQHHIPHAAVLIVLADLGRAELGLDRAVHVLHRHAQKHGLVAVDRNPQLLGCGIEGAVHARKLGPVARLCQKLLGELIEPPGLSRLFVLNPELKAARGADARNRRRRNGYEPALRYIARLPGSPLQHCFGVLQPLPLPRSRTAP